jgi:hypothetical protein
MCPDWPKEIAERYRWTETKQNGGEQVSDDAGPGPDDMMSDADRELLAALGEACGDDPLPVGIIDRADGLLTWADVDEELAELLETSSAELAGTRGASLSDAALEFQVADGTVLIEVDLARGGVEGQVLGTDVEVIVLERPGGESETAPVDELGHFSFPDPEPGAVRLRIAVGTGADVRTDWFVI